jgi:hypothetical protein
MYGLTTDLLSRACRIFLALAYPEGEATISPSRAAFLRLESRADLETALGSPICQIIKADGRPRGYSVRLGSAAYPHLKLQVVNCGQSDICVFAVDTHDSFKLDSRHPDAERCAHIQAANQRLKEAIERAWESDGLLTFNGLLRRGLDMPMKAAATEIVV